MCYTLQLTEIADINPEDLDDVQLFLTYKPYFLEYARQQMLRKRNQRNTRSAVSNPFTLRQRKEKRWTLYSEILDTWFLHCDII